MKFPFKIIPLQGTCSFFGGLHLYMKPFFNRVWFPNRKPKFWPTLVDPPMAQNPGPLCFFKVTSFGNLFTWGENDHGQLGDGSKTSRSMPGLLGEVLGTLAAFHINHVRPCFFSEIFSGWKIWVTKNIRRSCFLLNIRLDSESCFSSN